MRIAILGVSLCLALSVVKATTIDINSGPGIGSNNISGANVAIAVDPAWQPNGNGVWISFRDDTGGSNPGFAVPNIVGDTNPVDLAGLSPTAIFSQSFTLPGSNNAGSVTVWADDTARVLVDGVQKFQANGTEDAHCAGPNPIGCTPQAGESVSLSGLSAGAHTLAIEAFQRNGGPFGVMYQGSVNSTDPQPSAGSTGSTGATGATGSGDPGPAGSADAAVPEPGTYALLGSGLIALLGLARQRMRKA